MNCLHLHLRCRHLRLSVAQNVPSFATDFGRCEQVVKQWAVASLADEVKEERHTLKDLLFSLHIPRTAGCALMDW